MRLLLSFALLLAAFGAHAALDLGAGRTFEFASVEEGARLLSARDEFVERLSPFDRAARLKSPQPVDEKAYLAFVAANVLSWEPAERAAVETAFESARARLVRYTPALPARIVLVKTSGLEEGGAPYTRGRAIVMPKSTLAMPQGEMVEILVHEIFHVMSRHDAALRGKLYAAIGFESCPEAVLPDGLAARRITNPDAPKNDHRIRLKLGDETVRAIPVLYADRAAYDAKKGGEFFDYLVFRMLLVDEHSKPLRRPEEASLVPLDKLGGFSAQAGTNTDYVIHPEEILAVNFMLLVLDRKNLASPEVPERLSKILERAEP